MKQMNRITDDQALRSAMEYAGLDNTESRCLVKRCEDGLYEITVRTLYQKYEFYVDATSGEVLGINTEPLPYQELLCADPCVVLSVPSAA